MEAVVLDPPSKLRATVALHNRSQETWEQYDAVIDEYANDGVTRLADLRREVEEEGGVALQAAQAIGRMGVEGWPTLKALMTHFRPSVRHSAILGGIVELWKGWRWDDATLAECTEILAQILQYDTPRNRAAVLQSAVEFVDIALAHPLIPHPGGTRG